MTVIYYVFVALFIWAECLDFVGLRTLIRWARRA